MTSGAERHDDPVHEESSERLGRAVDHALVTKKLVEVTAHIRDGG
jgi:hypothetical protein